MKARLLIAIICAGITLSAQDRAPQIDSIRKAELRADLYFLASDTMRGRLTDTPQNELAAEWIKARFERLGLTPAGPQHSYYHPYNLLTATLGSPNRLEVAGAATLQLASGQDFYPQRFSASARAHGPVVFAGFGITSPAQGHDDYRTGDVAGKAVLVLDHEPGERDPASPLDGVVTAEAANALRKTLAAQARGAAAVLFVADVHNHPGVSNFEAAARASWPGTPPRIERYTLASLMEQVRIPAVQISPALAATLLARSGRTLVELARLAEARGGMAPIALAAEVDVTTTVDRHVVTDRNVLAMIEGSDPRLKDECVIVCAHFDHNGADSSGVFNGADDDGSGTVGLLEIAEAYALAARDGRRPRRSVLFAAWNSEERGLLGAWAYAEDPLVPRERIIAVLNMDMIGRNEEVPDGGGNRFRGLDRQTAESNRNAVNVIGTARSADMKAAVQKANAAIGLELKFRYDNNESNLMRRSDHWPFLQHGVPALWFHTGLHPDYHTVYDRPEKINYDKMENVAKLVYQMSWDLAQQPGRPALGAGTPTSTRP